MLHKISAHIHPDGEGGRDRREQLVLGDRGGDRGEHNPPVPIALLKEQRRVLSVNSNQRRYFREELLSEHSPEDYLGYIDKNQYQRFKELYEIAKGATSTVQTYDDYIKTHKVILSQVAPGGSADPVCRALVRSVLGSRSLPDTSVDTINNTLIDILANIVTTKQNIITQGSVANELNVLAMTGEAYNPANYWRPFRFTTEGIKIIRFIEPNPNSYSIVLPSILNHVKSIRLISTEIPNTINNITERNNILVLKIRNKSSGIPIILDPNYSVFNFVMVKLDLGHYSVASLLRHMQNKINETVALLTNKKYGDLLKISWNSSTGAISIKTNRPELEFHLKFYSEIADQIDITNPTGSTNTVLGKSPGTTKNYVRDLWYMLGFPWPYEIASDGGDKYTQLLTNVVNEGLHSVFKDPTNDIFQLSKPQSNTVLPQPLGLTTAIEEELNLSDTRFKELNTYRPIKYPDVSHRYIYLVLKGYRCISHINQHNGVIGYTDRDIFAKVLLDNEHDGNASGTGDDGPRILYNTFVSNPLIYPNAIDKIESLQIQWVDERGDLVDFNGADHSFTLEIIQYITQGEANMYSTTLGTIDKKSYPEYLA